MTEKEMFVARCWYDPRYEIVDPSDAVWWVAKGFDERLTRAYGAHIISREEYDYMNESVPVMDDEETARCHEIMVKIGLLRRVGRA